MLLSMCVLETTQYVVLSLSHNLTHRHEKNDSIMIHTKIRFLNSDNYGIQRVPNIY